MADDACNLVKTDLEAGTWTNNGSQPIIYIEDENQMHGGNSGYIRLMNPKREATQAFTGTVVYYTKSCTIEITAPTTTIRDNIYDDIIAILDANSKGYVINDIEDNSDNPMLFRCGLDVKVIVNP